MWRPASLFSPATRPRGWIGRVARRFPVALGLVGGLNASTLALRLPMTPAEEVRRWSSTNLDNLRRRPVAVLVASALVLPGDDWAVETTSAGVAVAVLEWLAGSPLTAGVFASGHVLATGATQWAVARGIAGGRIEKARASEVDVGISYGLAATVAAATRVLPRRLRRTALVTSAGYLAGLAVRDRDTASAGHLIAYGVGTAWWPVIGRRLRPARQRRLTVAKAG